MVCIPAGVKKSAHGDTFLRRQVLVGVGCLKVGTRNLLRGLFGKRIRKNTDIGVLEELRQLSGLDRQMRHLRIMAISDSTDNARH